MIKSPLGPNGHTTKVLGGGISLAEVRTIEGYPLSASLDALVMCKTDSV